MEKELEALRSELEIYKNNNAWCNENLKIINNPDTNDDIQSFGYRYLSYPSGPVESYTVSSEIYIKYKDCYNCVKIYYDYYEQSENTSGSAYSDITHHSSHETSNLSNKSILCILSFIEGNQEAMREFKKYLKDTQKESMQKVKCI